MATVRSRLENLEEAHQGAGKLIVMQVGSHTDKQISDALAEAGLANNPTSTVVVLRTIYETKDGSPAPDFGPPQILSVIDQ